MRSKKKEEERAIRHHRMLGVMWVPTQTDQHSQGVSLWSREGEWGAILAPVRRGGQ